MSNDPRESAERFRVVLVACIEKPQSVGSGLVCDFSSSVRNAEEYKKIERAEKSKKESAQTLNSWWNSNVEMQQKMWLIHEKRRESYKKLFG